MLHGVVDPGKRPPYIVVEAESESDDVECEKTLQCVGKCRPSTMSEDRKLDRYRNISDLTEHVALSDAKFGSVSLLPRQRYMPL